MKRINDDKAHHPVMCKMDPDSQNRSQTPSHEMKGLGNEIPRLTFRIETLTSPFSHKKASFAVYQQGSLFFRGELGRDFV
ncbi:hypothetical protein SDC9_155206 [bioreactor metagenome]|uniref:Uncharacterized protein n=1 Tax=bioreactor metagenome TaxID=1076179 RepID=A0A645F624_9ZZZZ